MADQSQVDLSRTEVDYPWEFFGDEYCREHKVKLCQSCVDKYGEPSLARFNVGFETYAEWIQYKHSLLPAPELARLDRTIGLATGKIPRPTRAEIRAEIRALEQEARDLHNEPDVAARRQEREAQEHEASSSAALPVPAGSD